MNCPRCESSLETYTLHERDALSCGTCGYLGVAVEHRSQPKEIESWQSALDRFRGN